MGLAGTTTLSSILHIKISEKTTDTRPPIGHPSICFIKLEFTEKAHSFVKFTNNFFENRLFTEWFN